MRFADELRGGRLLRRYKRFLADVALDDGHVITAHTPNPGAMTGLDRPGRRVLLSHHPGDKRKLSHSWELVRIAGRWVGVNPLHANRLVVEAIERGHLPELPSPATIRREVRFGDSRLDLLHEHAGRRIWIEVKTATWMDGRRALFPDAPTERGRRHLYALRDAIRAGDGAALCFVVQRSDAREVAPAEAIDPAYANALREVAQAGVAVYALGCRVGVRGIDACRRLSVVLGATPSAAHRSLRS